MKFFYYLGNLGLLNWMPDAVYLRLVYREFMGKRLNLSNPRTFNEKLQWLKLHDRNPNYSKMVDKYEAKKWVAEQIGEEYIIPTIGVWSAFADINFDELPNRFVLKCTHDSGGLVICKDKSNLDKDKAKKKINRCLRRNYYYSCREWPYKDVPAQIIAEPYIEDSQTHELMDYKFMCFDGKVKYIFTCTDRFQSGGLKVTFFDVEWRQLPFTRHYPASEIPIDKPKNLEEMISLSEKLSKSIPFVRCDFYEVSGKIYFGELTFFPGSGYEEFEPEEWDERLGKLINLPNMN